MARLRQEGREVFDGECLRLASATLVQRCSYSDLLATNRKADHPAVRPHGYRPDGSLKSFESSQFANTLGAAAFIVSADGLVLLSKQPDNAVVSPGCWAPTGAGSTDIVDARSTLFATFEATAARELEEEADWRVRVRLLAAYRNENAGGKPEAICVARVQHHQRYDIPEGFMWVDLGRFPTTNLSDPVAKFLEYVSKD